MRIAIMGSGGLGGYFGGCLAYGGQDVTFIARGKNLQVMREKGLQVHSPRGNFLVNPVQAIDNPNDVGVVDLILFCVKSYDVDQALGAMQPMVGVETAVLPVLNGIEHVAKMQARLSERHVLGGLVMINAHKGGPGVIHHVADSGQYQLEFGEWMGGTSPRCELIREVLTEAGLDIAVVTNIAERMWWKLAVFSGAMVLAVLRGDKATVWADETKDVVHKAVSEAVAVAAVQGVSLADTLPDDVVTLGDRLPPDYKPSLLVDLEQGNRLELEAITGFLTRLGKEVDVPTPVNDFIYASLKPYVNGMG